MAPVIDLNCDLGETVDGHPTADDETLFGVVTSANIACGFHAGDPETMALSCRRAVEAGVTIGAHVSYRDREGFGRRRIDVAHDRLVDDVTEQIGALLDAADAAGARVAYVKPHGALYNRIAADPDQASAVAQACRDTGLGLLGLAGSRIDEAATERGVVFHAEAFADRGYTGDGSLAPRGSDGALVDEPETVAQRAVRMALDGLVEALDGSELRLRADSLCLHGDTPGSVGIARSVRAALAEAGVTVAAFA